MSDVNGLRDNAEKARQAGGDRRMVVITPELAEQIADLAEAALVACCLRFDRGELYCVACGDAWDQCDCPARQVRAALARLDGEDTG